MKYMFTVKENDTKKVVAAGLANSKASAIDKALEFKKETLLSLEDLPKFSVDVIEVADNFDVESYIFGDLDL